MRSRNVGKLAIHVAKPLARTTSTIEMVIPHKTKNGKMQGYRSMYAEAVLLILYFVRRSVEHRSHYKFLAQHRMDDMLGGINFEQKNPHWPVFVSIYTCPWIYIITQL